MCCTIFNKNIIILTIFTMLWGCGGGNEKSSTSLDSSEQMISKPADSSSSTLKLISIEAINTSTNSTIIKWQLTKYATGQIEYGTDTTYGDFSKKEESFRFKLHTIHLKNLQPYTLYHYRIISEDEDGNEVISTDHTFKTNTFDINNQDKKQIHWGFKDFDIPDTNIVITPQDNLQDAIDSLDKGGTIQLQSGTYYISSTIILNDKQNIKITGKGIDKTIIRPTSEVSLNTILGLRSKNIIIENFTLIGNNNNNINGIKFNEAHNVLIQNIKVESMKRSSIVLTSTAIGSKYNTNITFDNIETIKSGIHGISINSSKSLYIHNCKSFSNSQYGLDIAYSDFVEIAKCNLSQKNGEGGMKTPKTNHLYVHDSLFNGNKRYGVKLNTSSSVNTFFHFENNIFKNTITSEGVGYPAIEASQVHYKPFAEFVAKNNIFEGNQNHDFFYLKKSLNTYSYGDKILELAGGSINLVKRSRNQNPIDDGVGVKSWGNP